MDDAAREAAPTASRPSRLLRMGRCMSPIQAWRQVHKLSPSGQEVATWKSCDCPGQPGWMVAPVSVAVDGTGNNVYVLDRSADTVTRYSPDGKIQKVFGSQGTAPANSTSRRPSRWTARATSTSRIGATTASRSSRPDGAALGQFGTDGNGPGQIHLPSGITVDRDGNMYVSDSDNWRMIKFAAGRHASRPDPGLCGRRATAACSTAATRANSSTTTASSSTARATCT